MKLLHKIAGMMTLVSLLLAGPVLAQVSKDGMGKVLPVELFACKYKEGKSAGDLDKVIARWSKYMDDNGNNDYAAWTLNPYYFGTEQDFDVLWMGAYKDAKAMGAGTDMWMAKGGELRKGFADVVTCNAHIGLSSAMYKAPASNETPTSGYITMMNCKLNEGHRYADIKAAELKWVDYLKKNGSAVGYWHWFPVFGGGDSGFDYKVVRAYRNFTEIGADLELNFNGGGREAGQEIFDDIDDCDDARVYVVTSRRAAKLR